MGSNLIEILKKGGVAVIPTDTIYGLVGQAQNRETVERIYHIKGRTPTKPLIILISNLNDVSSFGIKLNQYQKKYLVSVWPGPVSVILPCPIEEFNFLSRNTNSLAFRLPDKKELTDLISKTGPLVAPSANPQDLPPAINAKEAKEYFGNLVDFYKNSRKINGTPSKIIDYTGKQPIQVR